MKTKRNFLFTSLLASGALALPLCGQTTPAAGGSAAATSPAATSTTTTTTAAETKPADAARPNHFGGTVSKVDTAAKTVTIENKKQGPRTFQLTDSTKVTNGKAEAKLEDVKVGDHVHGAYMTVGGKMELSTLKLGAPVPKDKAKKE